MPATAVYFRDPDNNLLEFIAMLPDPPRPDLGVLPWSDWVPKDDGRLVSAGAHEHSRWSAMGTSRPADSKLLNKRRFRVKINR